MPDAIDFEVGNIQGINAWQVQYLGLRFRERLSYAKLAHNMLMDCKEENVQQLYTALPADLFSSTTLIDLSR